MYDKRAIDEGEIPHNREEIISSGSLEDEIFDETPTPAEDFPGIDLAMEAERVCFRNRYDEKVLEVQKDEQEDYSEMDYLERVEGFQHYLHTLFEAEEDLSEMKLYVLPEAKEEEEPIVKAQEEITEEDDIIEVDFTQGLEEIVKKAA